MAARRDTIERLLLAATKAGLNPQGVDLSAFAMIRALHRRGSTDPVLYVNVGGITNLAVAEGAMCTFTRTIPDGTSRSPASWLSAARSPWSTPTAGWSTSGCTSR